MLNFVWLMLCYFSELKDQMSYTRTPEYNKKQKRTFGTDSVWEQAVCVLLYLKFMHIPAKELC